MYCNVANSTKKQTNYLLKMEEKTRLIKPAWNETLKFLAGILDNDDARGLTGVVSENYFKRKPRRSSKLYAHYNPHIDDLYLSWECITENNTLFTESLEFRLQNLLYFRKISPCRIRKEMLCWQKVYEDHSLPFSKYENYDSYFNLISPEKRTQGFRDILSGLPSAIEILANAYELKVGDTSVIQHLEGLLKTASSDNPHEGIHATIRIIHSRNKPTTY